MTAPINSTQNEIAQLDKDLESFIKDAEEGATDPKKLLKIETKLKSLTSNPDIPVSVRESLQSALKNLKGAVPEGGFNLSGAMKAKMDLDRAVDASKLS